MVEVDMVELGEKELTLDDMYLLLFKDQQIGLSEKALNKTAENFSFLKEFSSGKLIYGINTGFGPMAQYKIADKDLRQLQFNLIRSHCSGSGSMIAEIDIKALMIARLSSLMKGYSGVSNDLLTTLRELINKNINPCVYEHGGVGASGDLVQLAHLALALIGEGEVMYKGALENSSEVFKKENINPVEIHQREGIALLNGTSAMTGISVVNLIYAKKLINWSVLISTCINELVEAFDDHFSTELNSVKLHYGQLSIAKAMTEMVSDSKMIRKRTDHLYQGSKIEVDIVEEKVQEYYSLRCVPQILGPIYDTIRAAEKVVMHEVNSVNDNPVIDSENRNIYHGGNFHGDYVALEMDKLKISITKLAMLAERQLNFLLNDKLNQKLPPFVNLGKLGLNYGSQGMQFTATSTVAECQTLSMPTYVHSIPNNNDNQDIVSMGANAALITRKVINNAFEVLAVQVIALIQAIDHTNCSQKLSGQAQKMYNELRSICPKFVEDRPLFKDIRQVTSYLREKEIEVL
ncbi:MAG TPA: aromatic amino acid ammonia-lyase [Bacteroidia bacterium]|nr:aromatic amino acid ammonia-lyase [Bacteroidia bacterium]